MNKIMALQRAKEQANNYRIRANLPEELRIIHGKDAEVLEPILARLILKANEANRDSRLTALGQQEAIAQHQDEAIAALAKADREQELADTVQRMAADMINRAVVARSKNKPADNLLSYLQESEMRQYLHRLRDEKRAEHAAMVAMAKEQGRPLSDEERVFRDPVVELFQHACEHYDSAQEQLVRAIAEAPAPIQLLAKETIDAGMQTLQKAVSPELAEHLENAKGRLTMYGIAKKAALEIVKAPLKHAVQQQQRPLARPDGDQ
jgi:hypothetical protein